jgi:hypothetical protein
MKRFLLAFLLFTTTVTAFSQRKCAANEVLALQMQSDPSIKTRMANIELSTSKFVKGYSVVHAATAPIVIHVVVNVLYKTTAQNISNAQIASQIAVLNADFAGTNIDYNTTPLLFQSVRSGNTGIRFVLDIVNRKSTTKTNWGTNDAMKKTTQGGLNPTSPTTKLNIWVCNIGGGILGYAQFPGGSSSTDGVVIDDNAFGNTGSASYPFNKGRTATHEIGHWLNLRHIWGDANCGNDFVDDTPLHDGPNFGCPGYPSNSSCAGTPVMMTMNYMDYTDDACMYMFSSGQKVRALAILTGTGSRKTYAQLK